MKLLFLVGYMGCGKTTVGRRLARKIGAEFADTDTLIEQQEGASVSDIFHYEGEEHFRELERAVIDDIIAAGGPMVVSTGGGLPAWNNNMERMNAVGETVYLQRTAEQIAHRLSPYGRQKRPKLRDLSDAELVDFMACDIALREPFYSQASLVIDCREQSDEQIIEQIVEAIER